MNEKRDSRGSNTRTFSAPSIDGKQSVEYIFSTKIHGELPRGTWPEGSERNCQVWLWCDEFNACVALVERWPFKQGGWENVHRRSGLLG